MIADISGMGSEYHVGDEAMAEVAIQRLKSIVGSDNLVMACSSPAAVPATYGIRSFAYYSMTDEQRARSWSKRPLSLMRGFALMLYQLLRCDVVFVCGGGNLTSVWPEVLESRLRLMSWGLRFKRRLILVSQTLGPYTPEHRARCQQVLSKADWIGVRDRDFSEEQIGLPVHFAVDDAVFLPVEHSDLTRLIIESHRPALALSLRQLGGVSREQLHELCDVVCRIAAEQNLRTVFIPHHAPGNMGDLKIAKDVAAIWPERSPLTIVHPIPPASALKALTAECELVLTMRYHQLVFALATGVPAIGICLNEYTRAKLNGAFEQFGLEPRVIPIASAADQLHEMVALVLQERSTFRSAAERVALEALSDNLRPISKLKELATSRGTVEAWSD